MVPGLDPETLMLLLERSYTRLRQQNPDRDEHWSLTNSWLARYGSSNRLQVWKPLSLSGYHWAPKIRRLGVGRMSPPAGA